MAGASVFGLATMLSRVLGLVREQVFAALVGAGGLASAFVVAFRLPNLLRDLFAEGALSSAFVPTFADRHKNGAPGDAFRLANRVMNLVALLLGGVAVVGIVFPEPFVRLLAGGFPEDRVALTATLSQLMWPFLPIVSVSAVLMGALTAQQKFAAPALAPTLFNLVSIATGLVLWLTGADAKTVVIGWSVGTVLGGLAQLLGQVPALRRTGWRWTPELDPGFVDPDQRRIARLMAPALIGVAATQVNIVINTTFASTEEGGPAWLGYAFRLMQLPIGVFGVAVATVAQSGISRAAADKDQAAIDRTVAAGLRLVAFLTLPATTALVVLGRPIIRVIYERGAFHPSDSERTAEALAAYAVGLSAYAAVKVLAPAFYALDRSRAPLVASLSAVGVNIALNVLLHARYGFAGLALGTSVGALANVAVLAIQYRRVGGRFANGGILTQGWRVIAACVVAGAAGWAAAGVVPASWVEAGLVGRVLEVGVGLGVLGGVFLLAARVLRIAELDEAVAMVRRRLGRRRA